MLATMAAELLPPPPSGNCRNSTRNSTSRSSLPPRRPCCVGSGPAGADHGQATASRGRALTANDPGQLLRAERRLRTLGQPTAERSGPFVTVTRTGGEDDRPHGDRPEKRPPTPGRASDDGPRAQACAADARPKNGHRGHRQRDGRAGSKALLDLLGRVEGSEPARLCARRAWLAFGQRYGFGTVTE